MDISLLRTGAGSADAPVCEEHAVHGEITAKALKKMPDEDTLFDLAELYKIFGDSTRIKILYILFEEEMCVCDIAEALQMTVSAISHQLRILKAARLVTFRRIGKSIFYSLADEHVHSILAEGMEHVTE
ncbi:MAG: helix-turn-helix transcriptional regulator [Clostridia bacterium]|nr:helix-turn-helix transcriptional regulator [Clostridia bacterium]